MPKLIFFIGVATTTAAVVGYNFNDGSGREVKFETVTMFSGTNAAVIATLLSNVNVPGVWIYRVDGNEIGGKVQSAHNGYNFESAGETMLLTLYNLCAYKMGVAQSEGHETWDSNRIFSLAHTLAYTTMGKN